MNLPDFLALFGRRKWILLLCVLIPAIIVVANSVTKTPEYSAVTTLQLATSLNESDAFNNDVQTKRVIEAYSRIASNKDVVAEVARSLSLEKLPIVDAGQAAADDKSLILTVTHSDEESARKVTDTIIKTLMAQSSRQADLSDFPLSISRPTAFSNTESGTQNWIPSLLLWSLVGLLIGLILAYLVDSFDPKLRSVLEIEQAAQLHTIAELPILKKNEPIVFLNGTSAQSEAYRSLRTILSNYGGDKPVKSLLLTSAKSGEGKSTIAVNLAIAMAQSGRKILLVDCDMRKPAINEILNIPNMAGVSNILLKQVKISDTIRHIPQFRVDIMTSGPPVTAPAELLNSSRMVRLVQELDKMYDIVIFDAPAILPVTDAVVLSRFVSSVVLVVGKDQVEGRDVEMAQRHLRSVGVNPLGVIINRVKPRQSKYYK